MNCSEWEEQIALYLGGDLTSEESSEVKRHLGDCLGCQVFASGLKESMALLQGLHHEPIDTAHFAAVRARVMSELEGGRHSWWRTAWVYGLAASAAALFLLLALHPSAPVAPRHVAGTAAAPDVPVTARAAGLDTPVKVAHRRRSATRRSRSGEGIRVTPAPPIVVKLLTDDPDVVIYWITDKSGE